MGPIAAANMVFEDVKAGQYDELDLTLGHAHVEGEVYRTATGVIHADGVTVAVGGTTLRRVNGTVDIGSDFFFCRRAKEAGYKIFAHYGYTCRHFKERELVELYETMRQRDLAQLVGQDGNPNTPAEWDAEWTSRDLALRTGTLEEEDRQELQAVVGCVLERVGKESFRLLDYGCGDGALLGLFRGVPGAEVTGCDFSLKAVELARADGHDVRLTEDVPAADVVTCCDVLQLVDDDKALVRRFLDAAPLVVYTVPNDCYPPAVEKKHRRVYTPQYIRSITPGVVEIKPVKNHLVVVSQPGG